MGAGGDGTSSSTPTGLIVSKMLACFTRAKLLKISAFLLNAVWAATALLEIGIAPVVRSSFDSDRLDRLEDAGMFYAGKIVEDLGFLAQCGVGSHGLAGNRNRARGPQVLRKNEPEQAAFQPQQRDFRVLDAKHFRQYHADVQGRNAFTQHRSQREQVFRENDFFKGPVFRLMGHRVLAKFNLGTASSLALRTPDNTSNDILQPLWFQQSS